MKVISIILLVHVAIGFYTSDMNKNRAGFGFMYKRSPPIETRNDGDDGIDNGNVLDKELESADWFDGYDDLTRWLGKNFNLNDYYNL